MKKYACLVEDQVRFTEDTDRYILFKKDGMCCATKKGADFSGLADSDIFVRGVGIKDVPEDEEPADLDPGIARAIEILSSSKVYNAMIISKPAYAGICVDSRHAIPAVLDDMAQIIGSEAKVVKDQAKAVTKALADASAVLVENGRDDAMSGKVIVAGRNLYEAYTGLLVLEKSAEIVLKSTVIGGARNLSRLNTAIQHSKYLKVYSVTEKEYEDAAE
jgi:hypothetical protein